ncbi:RIO1-domain-containing protein [Coprinopsis marcescibilis]|uniref:Serine/threonine-protein kinase RIO1 n=1 Tax=Coprinopsis marcescibilis TaxID=230819 RepID=A0A5C3L3V3_COPMA|nr:RIO1-domain-containing protein [Coprinopsis marcescibilis]
MASVVPDAGQFDDAEVDVRGNVAYIDTVDSNAPIGGAIQEPWPSSSEDEADEDSLLDEDEFFNQTRVEDEDWENAERDFTKQYNRLRQHVAVKTGNAHGTTSSINQAASVATLPAVNIPKAQKAAKTSNASNAAPTATTKDRTTSQLEAYAQKYTSRISQIDTPYLMGAGVNRKGPSAHANVKDKSDRATSEQVLDPRTRLILFKMIGRGLIDVVNGCVSTGKEANVYHAVTPEKVHLAIKIYKTSILVFKDRSKYVTGEFRFRRGYSRNPRKMVRLWAEKEMRNLKRLRAAGIECPEPMEVRENVLVMTLIGEEGWASPRLKDANLTSEQLTPLYADLLSTVRTIYHTCHLVHADLSEYNILYHQERLVIIDVSQSVEHDHPSAFDFLRSDLRNVEEFFARGGVQTLGIRKSFEFVTKDKVTDHDGQTEKEVVEKWLAERELCADHDDDDEEEMQGGQDGRREDAAHEDEVFMRSFIPRTLNEVYDPERDVDRLTRGEGKRLIYAETIGVVGLSEVPGDDKVPVIKHGIPEQKHLDEIRDDGDEESDDDEDDEDDEDEDGEGKFGQKAPRGHRHEDKDVKKERKKAVKAEAKEKRKNKIPKAEKKRLIKKTART